MATELTASSDEWNVELIESVPAQRKYSTILWVKVLI
jgi:hypothetical protein